MMLCGRCTCTFPVPPGDSIFSNSLLRMFFAAFSSRCCAGSLSPNAITHSPWRALRRTTSYPHWGLLGPCLASSLCADGVASRPSLFWRGACSCASMVSLFDPCSSVGFAVIDADSRRVSEARGVTSAGRSRVSVRGGPGVIFPVDATPACSSGRPSLDRPSSSVPSQEVSPSRARESAALER